jgi:hypothetical protein
MRNHLITIVGLASGSFESDPRRRTAWIGGGPILTRGMT